MPSHIKPLRSVWLKNKDGSLTVAQVETRRGGVYQILVGPMNETRRVTRSQIVRMK